jgi:hypothetical protein
MRNARKMPYADFSRPKVADNASVRPNPLQCAAAAEILATYTPVLPSGEPWSGLYPISTGGLL